MPAAPILPVRFGVRRSSRGSPNSAKSSNKVEVMGNMEPPPPGPLPSPKKFLVYLTVLCIMLQGTPCGVHSCHAMGEIMEINKDLIAASSTPIVLAILAEEDSYGYAILQRVRELSGGRMEWTDGMLYPVLHRLERLGYVEARWEVAESGRRRKYYRITSEGRAQLTEERRQWQAVDATLRGIWDVLSRPVPASQPGAAMPLPEGA
jgi:PadR family transcriptional regulator, regulatory protein PadR